MTLLILGRHGQLATHLRALAPEARCWGRQELDLTSNAANIEQHILRARPEAIINAAAYTAVDRAESDPASAWAVNVTAVAAIARAAEQLAVPLVHFSTDYVFDGRSTEPYTPADRVAPLSVYGKTKLAGELAVSTLCGSGWILRTSWVFSEYGNNFVKTMLRLGAERSSLDVVTDQYGRPSYAGDLASLALRLVTAAKAGTLQHFPGLYHLGAGPAVTWHAFAEEIFEMSTRLGLLATAPTVHAIKTSGYPTPARRPLHAVLAPSGDFQAGLGGLADWRDGLASTLSALACGVRLRDEREPPH